MLFCALEPRRYTYVLKGKKQYVKANCLGRERRVRYKGELQASVSSMLLKALAIFSWKKRQAGTIVLLVSFFLES